ncbi:hypothetical protein BDW22DRAFT_1337893, partial [Trametopsis cervina]
YTVAIFDIFTGAREFTVHRPPDSLSPAIDLMRHGYIAKSPTSPNIAVSVKTLDLLYRLRQRKPSYSIEAFVKVVCDFYNITYQRQYREIFGDTFEIYLRITRIVERKIYNEFGWEGPDWRARNGCRACCYKLEDEPPLPFSRLIAMDGNNSLKRMATSAHRTAADTRVLDDSDYFLPSDYVDRYANEVRGRSSKGPAVSHKNRDADDSSDDDDGPIVEGDPTDGLREVNPQAAQRKNLALCVKNWKSAAKEEKKKMWAIFEESGIFACACRHGFVLWVIDMVCSGELAKYPIAITSKILELEEPVLAGYDIGCSFATTISSSSLGPLFHASGSRFCVCAFHGYSHCYVCQLQYHPNIIPGAGLEDLETMERIFAQTNMLASVTRYASPYRRRLFIEAYLRQLDEDKYLNSGTFILNNYKQAIDIIENDGTALEDAMRSLDISEQDLDHWEAEELNFFSHLGEEDPHDMHAVAYVECLQQLRSLESKRAEANARFLAYNPATMGSDYAREHKATRRIEAEHRHANDHYNRVLNDICALELQMGIVTRWTPLTPEYIAAQDYIKERKYHQVLSKLQKLVAQRLFELQRLNVAQTGAPSRPTLSLQTRSKAIQLAITAYNNAASALDPPRPPLNWSEIGGYDFLEQFALLQDTRNDMRGKRWTEPAVRAVIKMRHRIRRAREELDRLNVEIRRLHTAIRDERILFRQTCANLRAQSSKLIGIVSDFVERRQRINDDLLRRVYQVYSLPGFTGVKGPGVRLGSTHPEQTDIADGGEVPAVDEDHDDYDALEGDEEQDALGHLVDFISALSLS